jgi:uncharacterized protein YehS (DUF1456 family)
MLRVKSSRPIRTTLNLADAKQVKSVRRRLGISDADLVRIVNKGDVPIGVELRRADVAGVNVTRPS